MVIPLVIRVLVSWAVIAIALGVTAELLDSVTIDGGTGGLVWVSALFGLVNALLGPLLRLLSLPLTILTFGLFSLVVNALLLMITAGLTNYLDVGGFWSAVGAAFVVSLVAAVLDALLRMLVPDSSV